MRKLLMISLILLPGLAFAQTDCRSVELPDHFDAICTGDEKAVPAAETPTSPTIRRGGEQQQSVSEQMQKSLPTESVPQVQPQAAAMVLSSQTSQTQSSPDITVHRQGRQQFKKGMDEAKAARQQLISELQQQSQPAQ
jgi:hypothetical protein